jgi:hypothetical protein
MDKQKSLLKAAPITIAQIMHARPNARVPRITHMSFILTGPVHNSRSITRSEPHHQTMWVGSSRNSMWSARAQTPVGPGDSPAGI